MKGPLFGVRVLEMGTYVAVPSACRLMAEYGADVVKIEPHGGDLWRYSGLPAGMPSDDFCSVPFTVQNNGKKLITLDPHTEEGKKVFLKMLEETDIFCTNVRMQSMQRMGLDYDTLKEQFPQLIYVHFNGYGHKGPDKDLPGYDMSAFWSRSGSRMSWVADGSFPMRPPGGCGDMITALLIFGGMVTALQGRNVSGKGTLVTNSLYGTAIWVNAHGVMSAQPPFNHHWPDDVKRPGSPVNHDYRCKDGEWLALVGIGYPKNFPRYCKALGIPEEIENPLTKNEQILRESGYIATITQKVTDIMLSKTSHEWEEIFKEHDLSYSRLPYFEDVSKDPQAWANDYLEEVTWGSGVKSAVVRPPLHFEDFDPGKTIPLGGVSQHTDEVLKNMGYSQEYIDELRKNGVII